MDWGTLRVIAFVIFATVLMGGAVAVGQCSKASAAPQSGDWMCMAVAEKVFGSHLSCDATGVDKNRETAKKESVKKCNSDCPTKCKVEVCIYLR
jgi:hypothetical protein